MSTSSSRVGLLMSRGWSSTSGFVGSFDRRTIVNSSNFLRSFVGHVGTTVSRA